jgi:hypothetical protein
MRTPIAYGLENADCMKYEFSHNELLKTKGKGPETPEISLCRIRLIETADQLRLEDPKMQRKA